jgi:hypothetical protein
MNKVVTEARLKIVTKINHILLCINIEIQHSLHWLSLIASKIFTSFKIDRYRHQWLSTSQLTSLIIITNVKEWRKGNEPEEQQHNQSHLQYEHLYQGIVEMSLNTTKPRTGSNSFSLAERHFCRKKERKEWEKIQRESLLLWKCDWNSEEFNYLYKLDCN